MIPTLEDTPPPSFGPGFFVMLSAHLSDRLLIALFDRASRRTVGISVVLVIALRYK